MVSTFSLFLALIQKHFFLFFQNEFSDLTSFATAAVISQNGRRILISRRAEKKSDRTVPDS